ncbi:gamma-glutamyltransferase [Azorhizobium oxalatiphilum]|uniref:Glutathione hydrolase proenzyme n=1 Tax=Azorhizobium oxalatiphilum TaxID=980631 RepID=A0A917BK93_9HYPH|nr:gamma-glutamyltransferase [Azorhizobium oxalatiphilum]GGF48883.1 gamma-glutamyltransferase [Azorhizobium oxalatiphilum]
MRNFFKTGRSTVYANEAAVATSHPLSSLAALDVLRAGGNAVDAAIAAVAVQCVVDPHMTGIGGDCFALYTPKGEGVPITLNGSGKAPAAAEVEWYIDKGMTELPLDSPHAVTVPGAIAAWCRLLEDHGTRPLGELLQPAIRLAEEGYRLQPRVARDWEQYGGRLKNDPTSMAVFMPGGVAPQQGDLHRQPKLAATLRKIAEGGRDAFYTGEIAEDAVARLNELGGLHTLEDFASAEAEYVTPVTTNYRGYDVYECPPNGQGLGVLMMLNALEGYDLSPDAMSEEDRIHLFAEINKQIYHHRDHLFGDPVKASIPVEQLLSPEWAAWARSNVDMAKAGTPTVWPQVAHTDTVYLCVVDKDGNAISFINSIFHQFGSTITTPKGGFLLHNRGAQFSLQKGHPNAIAPNKRPLHTIIPGMLMKDGRTVAPFGVMGGQYQVMGHVELLTNIIDRGMDVQQAMEAPRSFAYKGALELEPEYPPALLEAMLARGHTAKWSADPLGGSQMIWIDRDRGVLAAASEPRKDGMALGY